MIKKSSLVKKHNELIDRESAYEILNKKIEQITQVKEAEEATQQESSERKGNEKSFVGEILGSTVTRQIGRTVAREVTRGFLGILGVWRKKRKKRFFFT